MVVALLAASRKPHRLWLRGGGALHSGSKVEQANRIAERSGEHRGRRPLRQQLVYVAAVMRRSGGVPQIQAVQNKASCRG